MNIIFAYAIFIFFVLFMLYLDLKVFHKDPHRVSVKEALSWTAFWVLLALIFAGGVFYFQGAVKANEFLAGYLLEKALAVENIMVFVMIFSLFRIPPQYQHRVLYFGIIGALIFRSIFIGAGAALVSQFSWVLYVFAVFLIFTGIRMFFAKEVEEENPASIRWIKKVIPTTATLHAEKFYVRENGKFMFTPLFSALLAIEVADVIFAVDSIPAIFSITQDPFIVYTSNIFAILGLRSLYFVSGDLIERFKYLTHGVGLVLVLIGAKIFLTPVYKMSIVEVLAGIVVILGLSIAYSWHKAKAEKTLP